MYVVGTAGHVDHGKSTLVHAISGIDPDRLEEEKQRGMTIDLGFAWITLPSGRQVSLVDVPGHERFIKNMLAGVGGVDVALLVVAADEGVMPQTREHLAILDLLHVKSGVVALTKKDLVDQEWSELVQEEVIDLLKGTVLEGAAIVPVSAQTGEGLPGLLEALDRRLDDTPERRDLGKPRLPVDRVFSMSGFGTIVTGTLIDGALAVGQEVEVLPGHLRSRIRGLQTHRQKITAAVPGSRVAANLGGLPATQLERGHVVTTPGWLRETTALDVRLRVLTDAGDPLSHNASVTFHTGASEVPARVRLLDHKEVEPGDSAWAQLRLASPVALAKGDFFIIRSSKGTLGGGEVVDTHARRHRRFQATLMSTLETLARGSPEEILLQNLGRRQPAEVREVVRDAALAETLANESLRSLVARGSVRSLGHAEGGLRANTYLITAEGWRELVGRVEAFLSAYHRQFPLRPGMPKEELKSRLGFVARLFDATLAALVGEGAVAAEGANVRLPQHRVQLSGKQHQEVEAYIHALEAEPYSPPSDLELDSELLSYLVEAARVVKVSEQVVFAARPYAEMVERVEGYLRKNGTVSVGQVRDMFDTSRKYALSFMEHLDERRITRRVGDERVLRQA